MSPLIRYLLPIASSLEQLHSGHSLAPSPDVEQHSHDEEMVVLYQQARPLVNPHSSAAIKTLGKMLDDPELMRRMMHRNSKLTNVLCGRRDVYEPPLPSVDGVHHNTTEHLEFVNVCGEMMTRFDSQARVSRAIRLTAVKQLLGFYGLQVDDVAYRRWEQRLPQGTTSISLTALIQTCSLWFNEKSMIEYLKKVFHEKDEQTRNAAFHQPASSLSPQKSLLHLEKSHSAPHFSLHPFDLLKQQNDAAAAFSYEEYVKNPPVRARVFLSSVHRRGDERAENQAGAPRDPRIATQNQVSESIGWLRVATTDRSVIAAFVLLQFAGSIGISTIAASFSKQPSPRPIASGEANARCAKALFHALARAVEPAQDQDDPTDSTTEGAASARKADTAAKRGDCEGVFREHRDDLATRAKRGAPRLARAAPRAENRDGRRAQAVESTTPGSLPCAGTGQECAAVARSACDESDRKGRARARAQLLELTPEPTQEPEAALHALRVHEHGLPATARDPRGQSHGQDRQAKAKAARDRERASGPCAQSPAARLRLRQEARNAGSHKPKAEATLVEMELPDDALGASDEDEQQLAMDELWIELLRAAKDNDLSAFLPPTNSPPAALRYFDTSRSVFLPPFASSVDRNL